MKMEVGSGVLLSGGDKSCPELVDEKRLCDRGEQR